MLERNDWERLDELLKEALERPPGQRDNWIEAACAGDEALRQRLAELLRLAEDEHEQWQPGGAGGSPYDTTGGLDAEHEDDTPLAPGQRLGRYEVLDLLGVGGMGHVYRALDPGLGREVAIKALASAFRGDSASLRRFEREARVLATLSHPNIAAIYGMEQLAGAPYLILERVEGGTLAERLRHGPPPLMETLAVAVQVAEGLEEAHGKGVIHRDLKPSNVMLTSEGRVKLVDFGLAKTTSTRADAAASLEPMTAAGAILGTAAYMSPEQVNGQEVDARTDVWAFGCLLYEMLSGRAAFPGRSVPEVLAAVLRDDPDWSALPAETPAALRRLAERCLRREPRQRLQHIGDARLELSDLELGAQTQAATVRAPAAVARRVVPWLIAAGLAAVVSMLLLRPSQTTPATRLRLSLELPRGLSVQSDFHTPFAIAPSGTPLVIVGVENGGTRLYVRELDDLALRPLSGTEGAKQPFFSPDGAWVAFFADRRLKKVPLDGGPPLSLAEVGGNPRGGAWAADGSIVIAPSRTSGLVRLPPGADRSAPLTSLDRSRSEVSHRWPDVLPGGRWVLFTTALEDSTYDEARLEVVSLESGERRLVLSGASYGRYQADGSLVFVRAGVLYRVGFDLESAKTRGAPEVALAGVRYDAGSGEAHLAVSATGALVYEPAAPTSPDRYLAWLGHEGRLTRLLDAPRAFRSVRLGPDGRRVAAILGTSAEDSDLWVVDESATPSRISFGLSPHRPAWTPDGLGITVGTEKAGKWRLVTVAATGDQDPRILLESPYRIYPNAWSPDGRFLVYQEKHQETGWDLRVLEVDASGQPVGAPRPLAATRFLEANAAVSPDGRWVAYESDELDALVEVYLRSFPDGNDKVRAFASAARPSWGPKRQLYYWSSSGTGSLQVAPIHEAGGRLTLGRAQPVFRADGPEQSALARLVVLVAGARFDVDPAGERFLFLESTAPTDPTLVGPVVVLDSAGRP